MQDAWVRREHLQHDDRSFVELLAQVAVHGTIMFHIPLDVPSERAKARHKGACRIGIAYVPSPNEKKVMRSAMHISDGCRASGYAAMPYRSPDR